MKSFKINQSITDRQDASLSIFFREVAKIPMIDINEEISLSRQIKNGNRSAVNKLVESNLRFVISVAKQYQGKGLPLVDLIQAGTEGALRAAETWDESRGFKFISYAVWWIRQSIMQAISSECRTVRVPMNQIVNMNKINKIVDKFEQQFYRNPSCDELAEEIDSSSDKIALTLTSINKSLSLDIPFSNDNDSGSLLDIIPNSDKIDEDLQKESISKEINKILNKLPCRESDVIRMSFGIGMYPMTLEEIGSRFGIGIERIRQIQKLTLNKIKDRFGDKLKELL